MDNDNKIEDEKDDEKLKEKQAKAARCRDHALRELVETEKTYVNGLGKLIIIYMNPLKQNNYRIISISDHQTIFPSVVSTIYNLHNQLLAELDYNYYHNNGDNTDNTESITSRVGKVLIKYAELFKMYQIYMNGYERAQKALQIIKKKNKKFNKWLSVQSTKTSLSAGDLENLLILPIQRIPRYQLMIKEIIKQTEKINLYHNDLDDLRNTYDQILDITKLIEQKMKEYDNKKKVAIIERKFSNICAGDFVEPSRYYILESKYKNIKIHNQDGSMCDIILFLFNDCLIYGHYNEESVSSSFSGKKKLHFDHLLIFDSLFKCVIEDNYKNLHCLKIYSRSYSIWISFKNNKLRTKWIKLINNANDLVNNKYILNLQRFNKNDNDKFNSEQTISFPCFIPDDYSNYCLECKIKFTFTTRKHHCRQCGRLLCKICTNYRINSMFYNKNKKNQIIRCCKKCKDNNTFSILNKGNAIINNSSVQYDKYRANNRYNQYDHGYNHHLEIYNKHRIGRTNSSPSISSTQPLKSNKSKKSELKHRASTPLLLNTSSTTTISMQVKSPRYKPSKPSSKCKSLRISIDIKNIDKNRQKYTDKMPQSPHLNPPQEHGYNNDDSPDDEIDDEDKSISLDDIDDGDSMPTLSLNDNNKKQHIRGISATDIHAKQIKVIETNNKNNKSRAPTSRRSRSYAVGLLNECNLSTAYVGCVITDDETTTDEQSLVDQLILSSSGASAPSSGDSKDSPFTKKAKIRRVSFRFNQFRNNNNKKKHNSSKSMNSLNL